MQAPPMRCTRCGNDTLAANGFCSNCDPGGVTGDTGIPASGLPGTGFPQSERPTSAGFSGSASDAPTFLAPSFSDSNAATALGTPPTPFKPMGYATGPLAVGQAFGPRYHIIRVLGAGGMGVVYQAWDAELGVAVALKVIRTETLTEPGTAGEVERRFKRELLLARQVT